LVEPKAGEKHQGKARGPRGRASADDHTFRSGKRTAGNSAVPPGGILEGGARPDRKKGKGGQKKCAPPRGGKKLHEKKNGRSAARHQNNRGRTWMRRGQLKHQKVTTDKGLKAPTRGGGKKGTAKITYGRKPCKKQRIPLQTGGTRGPGKEEVRRRKGDWGTAAGKNAQPQENKGPSPHSRHDREETEKTQQENAEKRTKQRQTRRGQKRALKRFMTT